MDYYLSKRWRLKFRRDPDAGRVLFIGPLVVSLDVTRRPGGKARACAGLAAMRAIPRTPTEWPLGCTGCGCAPRARPNVW